MITEIRLGDIVRLKKPHPCGSDEWQVVRLGADIGIKCVKCHHRVLIERHIFEHRVKTLVSRGGKENQGMVTDRQKELEARLANLKARWPPHSVPPSMWQELETLEEELEKIKQETKARDAQQDSPD